MSAQRDYHFRAAITLKASGGRKAELGRKIPYHPIAPSTHPFLSADEIETQPATLQGNN